MSCDRVVSWSKRHSYTHPCSEKFSGSLFALLSDLPKRQAPLYLSFQRPDARGHVQGRTQSIAPGIVYPVPSSARL